jgi:hypothetical protein
MANGVPDVLSALNSPLMALLNTPLLPETQVLEST